MTPSRNTSRAEPSPARVESTRDAFASGALPLAPTETGTPLDAESIKSVVNLIESSIPSSRTEGINLLLNHKSQLSHFADQLIPPVVSLIFSGRHPRGEAELPRFLACNCLACFGEQVFDLAAPYISGKDRTNRWYALRVIQLLRNHELFTKGGDIALAERAQSVLLENKKHVPKTQLSAFADMLAVEKLSRHRSTQEG